MQMLQIYETTVLSDCSKHALHAVSIPSRSFAGTNLQVPVDQIVGALGLQKLTLWPVAPTNLGPALAVLSSPSVAESEVVAQLLTTLQPTVPSPIPPMVTPADTNFGYQAAGDKFVPFEQSPIALDSLSQLLTTATGAGIGAYAGFVLAGPTPLLLIAIPAGMILCGAAKGVADALEKGLRERLLRFLKGAE